MSPSRAQRAAGCGATQNSDRGRRKRGDYRRTPVVSSFSQNGHPRRVGRLNVNADVRSARTARHRIAACWARGTALGRPAGCARRPARRAGRRAAVRARHRVPRRTLVLAAARADPDRLAGRHRARSIRSPSTRRRSASCWRVRAAWLRTRPNRTSRFSSGRAGCAPTRLFDTQVAAGFIGLGTPSLAALVERLLERAARQGRPAHRLDPPPAARRTAGVRRGRRRAPARVARRARRRGSTRWAG